MAKDASLAAKGIKKNFIGTQALKGVDFTLYGGEIHALVGENGAGKTTLMNIICGVYRPDAGEIYLSGQKVNIKNPYDAQQLKISFVHQEVALCDDVTVAENIFMPSINQSKRFRVNYKRLFKEAQKVLEPLANIRPNRKVRDLGMSQRQIVEIARALSLNCKILVLDEPTSALSESDAKALFKILHDLKSKGISIVFVSHRMSEVFSQCDRVTVLRDGNYLGSYLIKDVTKKEIVNKMVGREIDDTFPDKNDIDCSDKNILFEIRDFSDTNFKDINFKLYKGEVLGLAGLVGSGRSELAQAVCRLKPSRSGKIFYNGKEIKTKTPRQSINEGIVYLTEDRKNDGLFLSLPINKNISAVDLKKVSRKLMVNRRLENKQANDYIKMFDIRCSSNQQRVQALSGGNQQKVLIAKLLTVNPKVIFMDEPTIGVDVGAKAEIYKLIRDLANKGIGVILISSELPEIVGMCDRVIVMHEGDKIGEVQKDDINEREIIHMASGITKKSEKKGFVSEQVGS